MVTHGCQWLLSASPPGVSCSSMPGPVPALLSLDLLRIPAPPVAQLPGGRRRDPGMPFRFPPELESYEARARCAVLPAPRPLTSLPEAGLWYASSLSLTLAYQPIDRPMTPAAPPGRASGRSTLSSAAAAADYDGHRLRWPPKARVTQSICGDRHHAFGRSVPRDQRIRPQVHLRHAGIEQRTRQRRDARPWKRR